MCGTMLATADKVVGKVSSCLVITKFTFSRQMETGKGHSVVTVLMGREVQGSQRESTFLGPQALGKNPQGN